MRKLLTILSLLSIVIGMTAVPAKKGITKTLPLSDGTTVEAQLVGDEHAHYWQTADGKAYVADGETYVLADMQQIADKASVRRAKVSRAMTKRMRKVSMGDRTHYTGKKKGLVILVQFSDVKFQDENNLTKYKRILNGSDYTEGNFRGSVSDYFRVQSGGKFELDFDVVGPYDLSKIQSYYGKNDAHGNDMYPDSMVVEAVKAADSAVNFKDYDWDNDGMVDQVFVLYAGKGEADGGSSSTIWPHMYELNMTEAEQELDGVTIDTYACSNEVNINNEIEGIGCFCHEFSHCMGYPDLYDTLKPDYGNFGLGSWDLMCSGSYNGDTFCPAGYSAYEKWMAGWLEPIELSDEDMDIENLEPISEQGGAYIIYNKAHPDEYLLIENRQKTQWDAELPGRGLMITHVDFDKTLWELNIPNSTLTANDVYVKNYGYPVNTHQRLTLIPADDKLSIYNQQNDLFPYGKRDSLTNSSTPKAILYNNNTDGRKLLNKGILNIKQNSDRTMNFHFRSTATAKPAVIDPAQPDDSGTLFYESFDKCNGTGGNDGKWTTAIATATLTTDNAGWEYLKGYGGYKCARFGSSSTTGTATTPAISLGDGKVTLTFKATAWNNDPNLLSLQVSDGATIEPASFEMKSFEWQNYTCTIKGTGTTRITFMPDKRFMLDEVKVVSSDATVGIDDVHRSSAAPLRCTDLQGRVVKHPTKGLYIINGKKVIFK